VYNSTTNNNFASNASAVTAGSTIAGLVDRYGNTATVNSGSLIYTPSFASSNNSFWTQLVYKTGGSRHCGRTDSHRPARRSGENSRRAMI
jgi:hypothetical protein